MSLPPTVEIVGSRDTICMADTQNFFYQQLKEAGLTYDEPLSDIDIDNDILELVSPTTVAEYKIIPVSKDDHDRILLVTYNEETFRNPEIIAEFFQGPVKLLLTTELNFKQGIEKFYNIDYVSSHRKAKASTKGEETSRLTILVDKIIQDAAKQNVSDIHLLPTSEGMTVQFRIYGHLVDVTQDYRIDPEEIAAVQTILSNKDPKKQFSINMPNAASWEFMHGNTTYYVRFSSMPVTTMSSDGNIWHKIVIRLLPQNKKTVSLVELGYPKETIDDIRKALLNSATGMFLLSGETGSGKTTTLYAMIDEQLKIRGEMQNVVTIEDPVEIHDSRYCQVQVRESLDERLSLTPTRILETTMRQDPNIILYGEIRTADDAEVVVEAATTGHKVFSTVHAKSCVATLVRLLDLNVTRSSLLGQINMIISQKLIGRLCPHCSTPHTLTDLERMVLSDEEIQQINSSTSNLRQLGSPERIAACPHCHGGYVGRIVIPEYLMFNTVMRDTFLKADISFKEIEKILESMRFKTMWSKAFALALQGQTDLKEILTVVGKE